MIRVYVAGPYSADNVLSVADHIGRGVRTAARLFRLGYAVYCPWLDFHYACMFGHRVPVSHYQAASMEELRRSDAILLIRGWQKSGGVRRELEEASRIGIPSFTAISDLHTWAMIGGNHDARSSDVEVRTLR